MVGQQFRHSVIRCDLEVAMSTSEQMTTLVTGATGRIGSRFVPRLPQHGLAVRVLARDAGRAEPLRERGAEIVLGDLRNRHARDQAVEGVDAIVHLGAAFRGVDDDEAVAVNQTAAIELGRSALAADVRRFVLASTNLVYGPGRGRPAREDDPPKPSHIYPATKAAAEEALNELQREHGLGLRIVRLAFVYGEGDPHLGESRMWARDWPAHKRLHLVHHADVAQALIRALRAAGIDGATFNAADDAPVSALELLQLNAEPVPAGFADRPLEDPWEGIVDTTRIRRELGFRPIYPSVYTAQDAGEL
jgi:nucleoside-diphosphate-sugar epimerase